jgi:hypothetical protein
VSVIVSTAVFIKNVGICHHVHKYLSVSVIVSTVVFIKNVGICQCVHKYVSVSVTVSTTIRLCLSLCSHKFANFYQCPQIYVSVIVSTKISQCLSSCKQNLPLDSNLDPSQLQYLITFGIKFPFLVTLSLEFFQPHFLVCLTFQVFLHTLHSHLYWLHSRNHVNSIVPNKIPHNINISISSLLFQLMQFTTL